MRSRKVEPAAAVTPTMRHPKEDAADLAMADYQYRVKLDYPGALASYDAVLSRQLRHPQRVV